MFSNYPPGVTESHPYFNQPDALEFDYDAAVWWIENEKLEDDLQVHAVEHYPDLVAMFRPYVHPETSINSDDIEVVGNNASAWEIWFWNFLDQDRRRVVVESFAESRWQEYEEYVS